MKEVKMRRYQNLLTVSGLGVIVFALWSVLKTILLLFFKQELFSDVPENALFRVILFSIIGLILLVDLSIRVFVGLSARSEGFGKKKGYAYIVFSILIGLGSLASLVTLFFDTSVTTTADLIVSVIVEATSLIVVIELLVAAFIVKKLKKELAEVQ